MKAEYYLTEAFFTNRSFTRSYDYLVSTPFFIASTNPTNEDQLIISTTDNYKLLVARNEIRHISEADNSLALTDREADQILDTWGYAKQPDIREMLKQVYNLGRLRKRPPHTSWKK